MDKLKGEITAFDPATVTPSQSPVEVHYAGVFFQQASVTRIDLSLDELNLHAAWSEFIGCTFRQSKAPIIPGGAAAQGSFGNQAVDLSQLRLHSCAIQERRTVQHRAARYENCRFTRCRFNGHRAYESDFVNCKSTGTIDGCDWGDSPSRTQSADQGRRNVDHHQQ